MIPTDSPTDQGPGHTPNDAHVMFLRYRGNIDIGTYRAQILLSELSAIGGLLVSPDMIFAIYAVLGLRPFYFPDNAALTRRFRARRSRALG